MCAAPKRRVDQQLSADLRHACADGAAMSASPADYRQARTTEVGSATAGVIVLIEECAIIQILLAEHIRRRFWGSVHMRQLARNPDATARYTPRPITDARAGTTVTPRAGRS
jgi:hypothetical protein